jgi:Ni,Fe-hydrogenase III component G
MDTQTAIEKAQSLLGPLAEGAARPTPERMDVVVSAADLEKAVSALAAARWGFLTAITGLDHPAPAPAPAAPAAGAEAPAPAPEGSFEALYHMCEGGAVVTLRVSVPHSNAVLPSVCGIIPSATLFERELIEMFGLTITGTPCTDHFILPEEWPAGVFPLRKDFAGFPETKPGEVN